MKPSATPVGMISMKNTQQSCRNDMRKDTEYDSESAVFFFSLWADCYEQFILLIEYLGMDPDSGRHASGLAAHTVYSLADFQLSNHINYYLFNHTLCLLHYTSAIYPMPDSTADKIFEHEFCSNRMLSKQT